jgi:hypothetical protein
LTSGDYTVRVIVWTDTGQTVVSLFHIIFAVLAQFVFSSLEMIALDIMLEVLSFGLKQVSSSSNATYDLNYA